MSAKWQPSDDELDGLARSIAPPQLAADQAEQMRTSVLANAASVNQLARSSRAPMFAAAGVILAAAAALIVWFTREDDAPKPRADIVAIGTASYAHEQPWPSYRFRLDDGRVRIDVATVDDAQRFSAITSDARLDVRVSKFLIGAEQTRLTRVDVEEGRVELTYNGSTIILAAGQTWTPPPVQTAEVIEPPPPAPVVVDKPVVDKPVDVVKPPARKPARVDRPAAEAAPAAAPPAPSKPPEPPAPKPGELDFRAGVTALRNGDASGATKLFASACTDARNDALGEDACFWVGAAAKRAGNVNGAREALARFLQQFPASPRAGEASALLGWLLYEANDLDAAESRFQKAAADRVPKVRESAERGLEAIKRRRAK